MSSAVLDVSGHSVERLTPKNPGRFYAPELDALRFAAFLLVFCRHVTNALGFAKKTADLNSPQLAHSALLSRSLAIHTLLNWSLLRECLQGFDFGVCLFFFLSAFLITRLLLVERETTGRVTIRDFYIRRCLRIWPLYFFFLGLILVASHIFPVLHIGTSRLLVAMFFVANWAAVLHGWQSIAIQPLWSVSVEEQFYLVWPLFAKRGRAMVICVSIMAVVLSIATLLYLGNRPDTLVTQVWPNTFIQGLFLAGGALTACFSMPEKRELPNSVRLIAIAIGAALWLLAAGGCHMVRANSPGALLLILGYLSVLAGTFLIFSGVAGWRAKPVPAWLVKMGKMSYGLYVFHVACLLLMQQTVRSSLTALHDPGISPYLQECIAALFGLLLTIGCAALSYNYLEKPFLRIKEHFTVVTSRPY